MAAMRIWIAGYGGPPAAAIGAIPVWIATGDGSIAGATEALIDAYGGPFGGATAVWIAGYGGPPPASIGAVPIFIGGYAGAGGSVTPPVESSVWSAADAAANGMTLSNGGLTVVATSGNWGTVRGTQSKTSGKLYVEFKIADVSSSTVMLGTASGGFVATSYLGTSNYSQGLMVYSYGSSYESAGFTHNYSPTILTPVAGDVFGIAVDFAAGSIWLSYNNVWENGSSPSLLPAGALPKGTLPIVSFVPATVGALFPGISLQAGGGTWTLQSTAASQKYAPPAGFVAWDGGVAPPPTSVWSSSDATANGMTLSNGGLTVTNTTPAVQWSSVRNTISKTSGKVYIEFRCNVIGNNNLVTVGLGSAGFVPTGQLGSSSYSVGIFYTNWNNSAGFTVNYQFAHWVLAGDVFGLAVDFATGSMWIAINGVWTNSNDPAAGLLPMVSFVPATVGALFAGLSLREAGDQWTLQPTAASQKYAPPSGFKAWDAP